MFSKNEVVVSMRSIVLLSRISTGFFAHYQNTYLARPTPKYIFTRPIIKRARALPYHAFEIALKRTTSFRAASMLYSKVVES